MTLKEKFNSIDQSRITADQKSFLGKMKNVTKDFTLENKEVNDKVEGALDKMIASFKEKMPDAIKTSTKVVVPKTATSKKTTKVVSKTTSPKRTTMSVAKEIRKDGESWKDAQKRATKMINSDKADVSEVVKEELDRINKFINNRKELKGISGTNIKRDSVRQAKPRGRRISKDGNVYYENRENRTDRLAPNYPKNAPFLAEGGYLTDPTFDNFQNQVLAKGGGFSLKNNRKYDIGRNWTKDHNEFDKNADHEVRYRRKKFAKGGGVEPLTKELYRLQRDLNSSRLQTYKLGDDSQEEKDREKEREVKLARFNEVLKELRESDAKFELGGAMATDLAGHTGGGDGGLNAGMPLDGTSGTGYSGLVGETGAMSSGEMFMNGGGLPSGAEQSYMITEALGNPAQHFENGGDFQAGVYAKGGSLELHGIKVGDTFIKTISGNIQKVKDKNGKIVYINLSTGERDAQPPLPFADGGMLNANERYVLEIKGLTGLRKEAIESYIAENNLTDNDVLNIVVGLGRKQLKGADVASAVVGKKGNALSKKVIEFAKDNRAMKLEEGGNIDAFTLRMVKGTAGNPDEAMTEPRSVQFKRGGKILSDKTNGYIGINDINKVVTKDGKVFENIYSDTAIISGVHFSNKPLRDEEEKDKNQTELFKKGGLPKTAIYIPKYKVDYIETEDGNKIKGNYIYGGVWIDMKKQSRLVEEARKEGRFEGGGKTTFNDKANAIAKRFVGKRVKPQYQKEYGKVYSKEEAKEVGDKITGSMVAKGKMATGGETKKTNRGGVMVLAKKIRKEGESWQNALKRAGQQLK